MARVWLITGASSGFGKRMTEEVLFNGEIAVATVRTPGSLDDLNSKYSNDKLLVVKCDVANRQDIAAAFDRAYEKFKHIDVVFNNAGVSIYAEMENEDQDELARNLFEVNFWGAGNVMREAVRGFRDRNPPGRGGRLINNSSVGGLVSQAGLGFYVASKHALEGLTESLVKEIDPSWGIKVTLIEPGTFKTGAQTEGRVAFFDSPSAYSDPKLPAQQIRKLFGEEASSIPWGDPKEAVRRIYEVSKLDLPPLRLPLGQDALSFVRAKYTQFLEEIKQYEGMSEGLQLVE